MMWLKQPEDGAELEGVTKPYCYHIHQFEELRPVLLDVVDWGQALGLDMSYGDHEDAPGQLELNFRFDRPVRTADNITTYRQVCAAVGRKHGVLPTCMPKPFTGVSANGHHHHFTLVDENGVNVFHDPEGPAQLSEIARNFLGGMLEHFARADVHRQPDRQLLLPDVGHGLLGPDLQELGLAEPHHDRARRDRRAVRVPRCRLLVQPVPDDRGAASAGLDGVRRKLDPGPPQQGNTYDLLAAGREIEKVPDSLGAALDALAADELIKTAMPGRLYKVFDHYKRDEWERYLAAVTDWERNEYLEVLP